MPNCLSESFRYQTYPRFFMYLARPEKLMRRRERRQRPSCALGYQQAVPGLQRHHRVVLDAAELVLLRAVSRIPPDDPRHHVGRKTLQAGVILVSDERFVGLGNRIHPDQIGAAIAEALSQGATFGSS
jgi:hypothetical protein